MAEQPGVDAGGGDATLLQAGHLGGPDVEHVGPAPKGAGAAAALAVGLQ